MTSSIRVPTPGVIKNGEFVRSGDVITVPSWVNWDGTLDDPEFVAAASLTHSPNVFDRSVAWLGSDYLLATSQAIGAAGNQRAIVSNMVTGQIVDEHIMTNFVSPDRQHCSAVKGTDNKAVIATKGSDNAVRAAIIEFDAQAASISSSPSASQSNKGGGQYGKIKVGGLNADCSIIMTSGGGGSEEALYRIDTATQALTESKGVLGISDIARATAILPLSVGRSVIFQPDNAVINRGMRVVGQDINGDLEFLTTPLSLSASNYGDYHYPIRLTDLDYAYISSLGDLTLVHVDYTAGTLTELGSISLLDSVYGGASYPYTEQLSLVSTGTGRIVIAHAGTGTTGSNGSGADVNGAIFEVTWDETGPLSIAKAAGSITDEPVYIVPGGLKFRGSNELSIAFSKVTDVQTLHAKILRIAA